MYNQFSAALERVAVAGALVDQALADGDGALVERAATMLQTACVLLRDVRHPLARGALATFVAASGLLRAVVADEIGARGAMAARDTSGGEPRGSSFPNSPDNSGVSQNSESPRPSLPPSGAAGTAPAAGTSSPPAASSN